jgi:hypothetical protein
MYDDKLRIAIFYLCRLQMQATNRNILQTVVLYRARKPVHCQGLRRHLAVELELKLKREQLPLLLRPRGQRGQGRGCSESIAGYLGG